MIYWHIGLLLYIVCKFSVAVFLQKYEYNMMYRLFNMCLKAGL